MKRLTKKSIERIERSWNERPGTYRATHSLEPSDFEEYDPIKEIKELQLKKTPIPIVVAGSLLNELFFIECWGKVPVVAIQDPGWKPQYPGQKPIEFIKPYHVPIEPSDIVDNNPELLKKKIELKEKTIKKLQESVLLKHNENIRLNQKNKRAGKMIAELKIKCEEFDAMKADRDYFQKMYAEVLEKNKNLQKEVSSNYWRNKYMETYENNEKLAKQNTHLKQELDSTYLCQKDYNDKLKQANEEIKLYDAANKESDETIQKLYDQIREIKQDHDTILKDCIKFSGLNNNLIMENQRLSNENAELKKTSMESLCVEEWQIEIAQLKQQLDITNSYLKGKEKEYNQKIENQKDQIRGLRNKLREYNDLRDVSTPILKWYSTSNTSPSLSFFRSQEENDKIKKQPATSSPHNRSCTTCNNVGKHLPSACRDVLKCKECSKWTPRNPAT